MYITGDIVVVSRGRKIREESRVFRAPEEGDIFTKEDQLCSATGWAHFIQSEMPHREVVIMQVIEPYYPIKD
jgi:hypothetical protein